MATLQQRLTDLVAAVGADIKADRTRLATLEAATSGITNQPVYVNQEGWHIVGAAGEPNFQNGWHLHDLTAYPVKFRKRPDGVVQLRGILRGGAGVAFTLPAGYRPSELLYIPILADPAVSSAPAYATVAINGDVNVSNPGGTAQWVSLGEAEFDTGQTTFPAGLITAPVVAQESWHVVGSAGEPAFQNSFVVHDANSYPVKFRKRPDGMVQMRGLVRGPAGGVVFTLPAGYRPTENLYLLGDNQGVAKEYTIQTDGAVTVNLSGANQWFSLGEVSFDTGQTTFPVAAPVVAQVTQEGWHQIGAAGEPAFQNTWGNFGNNFGVAGFKKYPDGRVRLRGLIKATAVVGNGSVMFTLPVGYRPLNVSAGASLIFPVVNNGEIFGEVRIASDGTVQFWGGNAGWVALDNIEFDTEQTTYPVGLSAPVSVSQEDWHQVGAAGEPAFLNSWVNYATDGSQVKASFKKTPDGRVRLAGLVKDGTSGNIFTLPIGYRPVIPGAGGGIRFPATASTAPSASRPFIGVDNNGVVQAFNVSGAGSWIDLSSVQFDVGQTTFPAGKSIIPVVNTLPAGATDGDEVYFQTAAMATDGIMWRLRYRAASASAYKWEVVGGDEWYKNVETDEQIAAANTGYVDLTTVGPSFTTPLAGDYLFEWGYRGYPWATSQTLYASISVGGVTATDVEALSLFIAAAQANTASRKRRINAIAANSVCKLQYKHDNNAAAGNFSARWATMAPIRVG